jgi:phenylacetate-CoA ligase
MSIPQRAEGLELVRLGDLDLARTVAVRAAANVPAYAQELAAAGVTATGSWVELPLLDKHNYLLAHPFTALTAEDLSATFAIFSSSGSSGRPFYWPQLKGGQQESAVRLRGLLEEVFHVHERRTLAIVGLALGSWIGGEHFSWVLKSFAAAAPYPFAVFSPGNHHDEILAMIAAAESFVDQVILFVCPSAIGHLRLRAQQQGQSLPLSKMRFIVIGEPFPESVRLDLARESGVGAGEPVMLSIFGSADTGVLGYESPASALVRGMCERDARLAADLGFTGVVPHLFHRADPTALLECAGGELCVTKWQGVPLLRYNLHDAVRLLRWPEIVRRTLDRLPSKAPEAAALRASSDRLPDVLAISGRADSCLLLCGTNLTEAMLDSAVRAPVLTGWLTGNYRARIVVEEARQRLELKLECRAEVPLSGATADAIYPHLVEALGRAQPEFKDDWTNIYRRWDDAPALRILALVLVAWPALADDRPERIKQRGLGS